MTKTQTTANGTKAIGTRMATFVNPDSRTFWTLRYNEDSKNVATIGGRIGTVGYSRRLHFASRDEVRNYVEGRIEMKVGKGYTQVA